MFVRKEEQVIKNIQEDRLFQGLCVSRLLLQGKPTIRKDERAYEKFIIAILFDLHDGGFVSTTIAIVRC